MAVTVALIAPCCETVIKLFDVQDFTRCIRALYYTIRGWVNNTYNKPVKSLEQGTVQSLLHIVKKFFICFFSAWKCVPYISFYYGTVVLNAVQPYFNFKQL